MSAVFVQIKVSLQRFFSTSKFFLQIGLGELVQWLKSDFSVFCCTNLGCIQWLNWVIEKKQSTNSFLFEDLCACRLAKRWHWQFVVCRLSNQTLHYIFKTFSKSICPSITHAFKGFGMLKFYIYFYIFFWLLCHNSCWKIYHSE